MYFCNTFQSDYVIAKIYVGKEPKLFAMNISLCYKTILLHAYLYFMYMLL